MLIYVSLNGRYWSIDLDFINLFNIWNVKLLKSKQKPYENLLNVEIWDNSKKMNIWNNTKKVNKNFKYILIVNVNLESIYI